jgi:Flp pilus assembly protein TadD
MMLMAPTGWHWARLGLVRTRQERWGEAREAYAHALEFEPANLEYLAGLSYSQAGAGDARGAAMTLERALALAPRDVGVRRLAIQMWAQVGDGARVDTLVEHGVRLGIARGSLSASPDHRGP